MRPHMGATPLTCRSRFNIGRISVERLVSVMLNCLSSLRRVADFSPPCCFSDARERVPSYWFCPFTSVSTIEIEEALFVMSWKMMVFYHIEYSKVNRANVELRRKRGFQAIEGFGKSPVRRVAPYHCRDERSSRPFPQWPAHRAGIRPMPITHESNGHHPGIQCPLDSDSMPIGFRFNAHWIQIQCPLDSDSTPIGFRFNAHWIPG